MNCNKGKQLVKFEFMWIHRSCQWDDGSAFLVPGHCLAHVKGILLPTVISQHPSVQYIAKLHSRTANVSAVLRLSRKALRDLALRASCSMSVGNSKAVYADQCTGECKVTVAVDLPAAGRGLALPVF